MTSQVTVGQIRLTTTGTLERRARHRAAKLGYRVHRSRRRKGRDNDGQFMLVHKASSTVLLGAGFSATAEMVLAFMEQEIAAAGAARAHER
jgi:hypothetical protein